MAPPKTKDASRGTVHGTVLSDLVSFTIRAVPLPPTVIDFLQSHTSSTLNMLSHRHEQSEDEVAEDRDATEGAARSSGGYWALSSSGLNWKHCSVRLEGNGSVLQIGSGVLVPN